MKKAALLLVAVTFMGLLSQVANAQGGFPVSPTHPEIRPHGDDTEVQISKSRLVDPVAMTESDVYRADFDARSFDNICGASVEMLIWDGVGGWYPMHNPHYLEGDGMWYRYQIEVEWPPIDEDVTVMIRVWNDSLNTSQSRIKVLTFEE